MSPGSYSRGPSVSGNTMEVAEAAAAEDGAEDAEEELAIARLARRY